MLFVLLFASITITPPKNVVSTPSYNANHELLINVIIVIIKLCAYTIDINL